MSDTRPTCPHEGHPDPLVVVRVSGLPAETMAPFTSPVLLERLTELERLEERIGAARQRMVGRLYEGISDTLPPLRGFLLALKRDCYNGRRLNGRRGHASWAEADRLTDGELSGLADLERRFTAAEGNLTAICREERRREHAHLLTLLDDERFLRGVALASPLVAGRLHKLAKKPIEAYGRKEHRLAVSLLRYASRAALKLSPYSTLTTIGLARAVPDGGGELDLQQWRDRSLLRLRCYVLDRVIERLLRHPEVRARFRVIVNDSISEQETGRYRFVRPGRWDTNPKTGESSFLRDSLVEVRLGGALPGWLLKELRERPRPYLDLVRDMACELGDGEADEPRYAQVLDQLLDLGFSCLEPPWPVTDPHLELRLLRELESLPADAELAPAREALGRLVDEQRRFDASPCPAASIRGIRRATAELWQLSGELSDLGSGPESPAEKAELYEDVFLQPSRPSANDGEILRIPRERAERLLRSLDPLTRLAGLYQSRLEFLVSLSAFGVDRWSAGTYVPMLDVFQAARSLWRDYARHRYETPSELFNPLGLPELERLRLLRQAVHARMLETVTDGEDGLSLSSSDLEEPLATVPEEYRSPVGPCLFVQPLDTRGERWVLNRLYEGTGRFASRFTSVMPSAARRAYTSRMRRSSRLQLDGEPVTLLDLLCVQGGHAQRARPRDRRRAATPGRPRGRRGRGAARLWGPPDPFSGGRFAAPGDEPPARALPAGPPRGRRSPIHAVSGALPVAVRTGRVAPPPPPPGAPEVRRVSRPGEADPG